MLPDQSQGRAGPGAWLTDPAGPWAPLRDCRLGEAALVSDMPPGWKVKMTADLPAQSRDVSLCWGGGVGRGEGGKEGWKGRDAEPVDIFSSFSSEK